MLNSFSLASRKLRISILLFCFCSISCLLFFPFVEDGKDSKKPQTGRSPHQIGIVPGNSIVPF